MGKSGKVVEASPELLSVEPLIIESRGCRLSLSPLKALSRRQSAEDEKFLRRERNPIRKGGGEKEGGEWKLNFVTNTRTNVDAAGPALRPRRCGSRGCFGIPRIPRGLGGARRSPPTASNTTSSTTSSARTMPDTTVGGGTRTIARCTNGLRELEERF